MPEGYFKKVRNIRPEKPIFSPPFATDFGSSTIGVHVIFWQGGRKKFQQGGSKNPFQGVQGDQPVKFF